MSKRKTIANVGNVIMWGGTDYHYITNNDGKRVLDSLTITTQGFGKYKGYKGETNLKTRAIFIGNAKKALNSYAKKEQAKAKAEIKRFYKILTSTGEKGLGCPITDMGYMLENWFYCGYEKEVALIISVIDPENKYFSITDNEPAPVAESKDESPAAEVAPVSLDGIENKPEPAGWVSLDNNIDIEPAPVTESKDESPAAAYTSKAKDKAEKAMDEMFIRNLENAINATTGHWENPVKELFSVKTRAYRLLTGENFTGISNANLSMCKAVYGYTHNAWIGYTELKELEKKVGIKFDYPDKNKLKAMLIRPWYTWCYKAIYEVNFDGDYMIDENGKWIRAENRMDTMTKWHKDMTAEEVNENGYYVEKWEHKYTDVYNVEQIDWKGYDYTKYLRVPVVCNDIEIDAVRIEQVRAWMLENYKGGAPAIKLTAGNTNYYDISKDAVYMVAENKFVSTGEYLSSFAHEIAHSTGAKNRLGRDFSGRFGSPSYAVEELVAETSSLMIMALSGTKDTIENSLRYLKGWLKKAKETSKLDMVFSMAKQAVMWTLGEVEDVVPVGIFAENEKDESPAPVAESKDESAESAPVAVAEITAESVAPVAETTPENVEQVATVAPVADNQPAENATPEPAPDNPAPVAEIDRITRIMCTGVPTLRMKIIEDGRCLSTADGDLKDVMIYPKKGRRIELYGEKLREKLKEVESYIGYNFTTDLIAGRRVYIEQSRNAGTDNTVKIWVLSRSQDMKPETLTCITKSRPWTITTSDWVTINKRVYNLLMEDAA